MVPIIRSLTAKEGETPGDFLGRVNAETATGDHLVDVEEDTYHQCDAMSQTRLKRILKSAKYFKYREENPEKPTAAMKFGTMIHRAFLEPSRFNEIYVEGPDVSRATKRWKEFVSALPGKEVIMPAEMEDVRLILESLKSHDLAMSFFQSGHLEICGYSEIDGVRVRCRADKLIPDRKMITDLKTTVDCSPHKFTTHAYEMGYHIQAASYLDIFSKIYGVKFEHFVFVVVDKSAPYDIQVYVAEEDFIKRGRSDYMDALKTLNECKKTDVWPGYQQQVLNLSLPRWVE